MKLLVGLCLTLVALTTADDCNVGNTDVWWGDLYNYMSYSFQACKEQCRTDSRCQAVVYYYSGLARGKCFIKNGSYGTRGWCSWCQAAFKPCITQEGPCQAGQYKSNRLTCSSCPANTFSSAGSGSCSSCPTGHFSGSGASSCSPCPVGTYNGELKGSCKPCPANTYNDVSGAAQCKTCGDGYTSPMGSTSAASCERVNGAHCWVVYDDFKLIGSYGDAMSYEAANAACFENADCTGVSCRRRKGRDDECYLGEGDEHEEEREKWYTALKEC